MRIIFGLSLIVAFPAFAQETSIKHLSIDPVGCLAPLETYPFKLAPSDPLYDTARDDHQRHLEELEDYVNCLDYERNRAIDDLRTSFDLFLNNFGRDAALEYAAEKYPEAK